MSQSAHEQTDGGACNPSLPAPSASSRRGLHTASSTQAIFLPPSLLRLPALACGSRPLLLHRTPSSLPPSGRMNTDATVSPFVLCRTADLGRAPLPALSPSSPHYHALPALPPAYWGVHLVRHIVRHIVQMSTGPSVEVCRLEAGIAVAGEPGPGL
jgi:hypothetical protein